MRARIDKIGEWALVGNLISNLASHCGSAGMEALNNFGEKVVEITKGHIDDQDLGWIPLMPETIARKLRVGYSENILVASSTYYDSITFSVGKNEVVIGVPSGTREPNGADTAMVAAVHEFGSQSAGIPARPLWQPSLQEALEWHFKNNRPEQILLRKLNRYR